MQLSRRTRLPAVLALGALAALGGGCAKKPPPVVKADPGEVEYAGCYEVHREGPTCYVGTKPESRTLSLHPVRKAERYEIWAKGKPVPSTVAEGTDGPIYRLTVPESSPQIELRAMSGGETRIWELRVAEWPEPPEWIEQAWKLAAAGGKGIEDARNLLDREIARCTKVEVRMVALARRAELEPGQAGDPSRYKSAQRMIETYRKAGFIQGEVFLAARLAFGMVQQHDFGRARSTLEGIEPLPGAPAEAVRRLAFYKGVLAKGSGDFRTAIGDYRDAADIAGRVGLDPLRAQAQLEESTLMIQLGRFHDAEALLVKLATSPGLTSDPCNLAILLANRGWGRYLARESGDWGMGDPIPQFLEARRVLTQASSCNNQSTVELIGEINLALAYLQAKKPESAEEVLSKMTKAADAAGLVERMWWMDLRAQLALGQRRAADALSLYRQLDNVARATSSPENQWRAAFGKARALAALDRLAEAAKSLEEAETLVDSRLSRVPLGGDRESFSDQGSSASRFYVEVLLRMGQKERALQVARRARGRVLAQLARSAQLESLTVEQRKERDASLGRYWELRSDLDQMSANSWRQPKIHADESQTEISGRLRDAQLALDHVLSRLGSAGSNSEAPPLRRVKQGDLLLAYFPLSTEQQWAAFCDDGTEVSVREFLMPGGNLSSSAAQAQLSSLLMEPFRQKILVAKRLVILPYGRLRTVDFQALPFGGGGNVLISERPVIYSLDLPERVLDTPRLESKAVVIADSRGDLPEAREEGYDVREALRRLRPSWTTHLLEGQHATADEMRRAISQGVDLLHYAGHADFSGRGGWESQIPLAHESRMTLGDILTLERQPRWVVLSGCETGASDETALVESQGLAHAFLLGGSQAVVAATRKVNDKIAHELVLEMYRNMGRTPDLAILLQKAQTALRKRGVSQREWSSFRIFEP